MELQRNNLDQAQSPYLRQHADNPVWWQEWTPEVIEHARSHGKPLFVSVGYATCHWCHVMAGDTFSDQDCADYLNEHFVSIKVDREERPDIDQFLMDFLVAATGQGGWPLNVVLTPDLRPFFGITYLGSQPRFGRPGFQEVMEKVLDFWRERNDDIRRFTPQTPTLSSPSEKVDTPDQVLPHIRASIWSRFDEAYGGFGTDQKFPPHSTLLYLLFAGGADPHEDYRSMLTSTIDAMITGGLHDHLQGGFFRYCTDREWRIPHFEKMLYDQAMLLWVLSLAAHAFDSAAYAAAARGTLRSLRETFRSSAGTFVSAHDADTEHVEGGTYIWSYEELSKILDEDELSLLEELYELPREGNFEGAIHLIRRADAAVNPEDPRISALHEKLLARRRGRAQPAVDEKIVTSWNALAGIGLVHAYRYLGDEEALPEARTLFDRLWNSHVAGDRVYHSSLAGEVKENAFLQDAAALMLFAEYLHEDTRAYADEIARLRDMLQQFQRDGEWLEADAEDFMAVPAPIFDSPTPSATSLAELALLRHNMMTGELYEERPFAAPLVQDALNIAALGAGGYLYLIESPEPVPWREVPIHSVQAPGERTTYCYKGLCTPGMPPVSAY
jgi:hypothetical protein